MLHTCQSTEIFPGELAQPVHYDDGWIRTPPRPRPLSSINTIWALDDFHEGNGSTVYYPGSHLWPEGREPTSSDVPKRANMTKGSVLVFLSTLFHGGGPYPVKPDQPNTTGESRMGLIFLYCQPWLRCVENWFLLMNPSDVATLDPKLRTMLGFDLLGLVGNANGLHPMKALDTERGIVHWNRRSGRKQVRADGTEKVVDKEQHGARL